MERENNKKNPHPFLHGLTLLDALFSLAFGGVIFFEAFQGNPLLYVIAPIFVIESLLYFLLFFHKGKASAIGEFLLSPIAMLALLLLAISGGKKAEKGKTSNERKGIIPYIKDKEKTGCPVFRLSFFGMLFEIPFWKRGQFLVFPADGAIRIADDPWTDIASGDATHDHVGMIHLEFRELGFDFHLLFNHR